MKVVVIGGGIVGASVAYHLATDGKNVVVVDKEHEGQATAAGAGIVCPWLSSVEDLDWHVLAREAASYYPELIAQLFEAGETDLGYELVGAMRVSGDPEELDAVEELVRKGQELAPEVGEVSRLSPEEARGLFPPLREDLAAIHVTGGARVDGRLLRGALLRVAEKYGAKLLNGDVGLIEEEGKVIGVHVNEKRISADAVVLAGGAWAKDVLRPLGVELPVEPQKGQILHLQLDGVDTSKWPVVLPGNGHYLLAFDDSRVVVGATRETGAGFDSRVTASGVNEILSEALSVAPGLADGEVKEIRVGLRPVGPDILPLLGKVLGLGGVVVANALGASGLTLGPYVGLLAGKLAVGEKIELDLNPYSPMRKGSVNRE